MDILFGLANCVYLDVSNQHSDKKKATGEHDDVENNF